MKKLAATLQNAAQLWTVTCKSGTFSLSRSAPWAWSAALALKKNRKNAGGRFYLCQSCWNTNFHINWAVLWSSSLLWWSLSVLGNNAQNSANSSTCLLRHCCKGCWCRGTQCESWGTVIAISTHGWERKGKAGNVELNVFVFNEVKWGEKSISETLKNFKTS